STVFWNGSQGVVECETTLGAGRYALLWNTDPHAQLSSIAENQIRLMINYNTIQLLTPPYVKSDRVLVPLRVIAENMGAKVSWDPGEQRVDIVRDNHVIKLWLGSTEAKKDQQTLTIDISPEAVNGSTYVPLRFISEALGAKIEWDEVTQTAKVVQTSL
ncbi:MAG TPA: copper amine oxidase N-terminal domain-containing protein, partial [Syntrophomonadaceae bacterium]|nr:copper amine oxidase N-terminal domain-containing protein [Syntrophomonadaceae bacterium]